MDATLWDCDISKKNNIYICIQVIGFLGLYEHRRRIEICLCVTIYKCKYIKSTYKFAIKIHLSLS